VTEEELIGRYVELNPHKPWLAEARLIGSAISVWALVGALPAVDGDLDKLAAAYDLPREAVDAAMAFYRRHRCLIDARLAANDPTPAWPYAAARG
jgi:uncharacterized protein (DUF433 family)